MLVPDPSESRSNLIVGPDVCRAFETIRELAERRAVDVGLLRRRSKPREQRCDLRAHLGTWIGSGPIERILQRLGFFLPATCMSSSGVRF